jgi:Tol biopolymer transport system component
VAPYPGGSETTLSATGRVISARWVDSVTVSIYTITGSGPQLLRTDIRTGASAQVLQVADSAIADVAALPNGWAWIPGTRDRVIVEQNGQRHEILKAPWYASLIHVAATADGSRLVTAGWNASTSDTLRLDVVPTAGGAPVEWTRQFAEDGLASWLADGSIAFTVWTSTDAATMYQLSGAGQEKKLGPLGHVSNIVSVSDDLKRATVAWREYRGDAWMYRVVKP